MEETITLSQMADLIIVMGFGALAVSGFAYILTEGISLVVDGVKGWRKKRKERKANKEATE